jgi:hypothetical protein
VKKYKFRDPITNRISEIDASSKPAMKPNWELIEEVDISAELPQRQVDGEKEKNDSLLRQQAMMLIEEEDYQAKEIRIQNKIQELKSK